MYRYSKYSSFVIKGILLIFSVSSKKKHIHIFVRLYVYPNNLFLLLKGEFTFFIRELDVHPLGESNLMGPKKSLEVKFFTVAFFGVCLTLLITLGTHFCHSNSSHHHIRPAITFHHILHIFQA